MKKLSKTVIRCLGQNPDTDETCPDRCARWIDVTQEHTEEVRIVSMMRESKDAECKKRIEK